MKSDVFSTCYTHYKTNYDTYQITFSVASVIRIDVNFTILIFSAGQNTGTGNPYWNTL